MVDHPRAQWPSALVPAQKEFEAADAAYRQMIGIPPFADYEAAWREFLHRIDRVWKKAKAASSGRPGWQKFQSTFDHLRSTDPLLRYLRHARNSDEHTISPVAKEWDPKVKIEGAEGKVKVAFEQWARPLLAVTDRGQVYDPPDKHLDRAMSEYRRPGVAEPRIVAELALRFYCDFLNQVAADVFSTDTDG